MTTSGLPRGAYVEIIALPDDVAVWREHVLIGQQGRVVTILPSGNYRIHLEDPGAWLLPTVVIQPENLKLVDPGQTPVENS